MTKSGRAPLVGACAAALIASSCASTAPGWPQAAPTRAYAPVIERDAYGVPLVRGETDADVAYGVGYAHAEDDFENIQRQILTARGRMAARFGREGAGSDFLYHLIDVRGAVEAGYERDLSPETRAILEAYAAGINAYGAAHPEEVWRDARNVTGRDVVAGFVHNSPIFWGFDSWLVPLTDEDSHPCAPRPLGPRIEDRIGDRGSNAFAVAPSRSDDGRTRLIVNSHQPWTGPVAWWEVRLESGEGWRFHGGTFAGSPVPFVGHNGALGYAATVNYPDLADYYLLTTDAAHPGQYFYDGAWRYFETRRVTIQVKIGPIQWPVSRTLHYSVHGPAFETGDGWVAVRAAGVGDVRGVEQYYRMSRAQTFADWQAALEMQAVPSTNLIYADGEGHIGFFYNARFPDRPAGEFDWRHCAPGDTSAALWTQYLPPDAAPRLIDPASGWVYSANGSPFSATDPSADLDPAAYAETLGIERWMTNRGLRAVELLSPQARISDSSLLAAKYDITYSARSGVAEALDALIGADVGEDAELQRAQALLRDWDRAADADARAMALAYYATAPYLRARWRREPPPADAVAVLRSAVARMQESFGRIDPPWGEVLRLKRGDVDIGLEGGPDLLRAVTFGAPEGGKLVGVHGDGLIIVADWGADGSVRTRTVSQFGAAAERPGSPHYNDQAEIFARYGFRFDETTPPRE